MKQYKNNEKKPKTVINYDTTKTKKKVHQLQYTMMIAAEGLLALEGCLSLSACVREIARPLKEVK